MHSTDCASSLVLHTTLCHTLLHNTDSPWQHSLCPRSCASLSSDRCFISPHSAISTHTNSPWLELWQTKPAEGLLNEIFTEITAAAHFPRDRFVPSCMPWTEILFIISPDTCVSPATLFLIPSPYSPSYLNSVMFCVLVFIADWYFMDHWRCLAC